MTVARRTIVSLLSLAFLVALGIPAAAGPPDGPPGRYIVVLQEGADPEAVAREHDRARGVEVERVYEHALAGYGALMSPRDADRVAEDPRVAFVERDQRVEVFAQTLPTGIPRTFATANTTLNIDGVDDLRVDVDVAIIDTGIDYDHPDLDVVMRTNCARGGPFGGDCKDNDGDDGNGHGTHVAGTVAAIDNGIGVVGMAPGARLWAVRVLDNSGSGWMSWVVSGVDWVTAHASDIEVANMSLGCECDSDALDQAIADSVSAGVVYAVAAGNSDEDAASHSPANHPDVITVSALADFDGAPGGLGSPTCRDDQDDTLADFSNWGSLIEVAAPGVCILSTWKDGGYETISGTSMASPHAAGAAAILASKSNPNSKADADNIRQTIVDNGNFDWTDDSGDGTQEPLLDVGDETVFDAVTVSGSESGGGGDTNSPPTASFTHACTDLTCDFDSSGSSDSDGSISSYDWDFGDGNTASGVTVTHTYGSSGDYTVTLTVTDDDGATDSESQVVSVSDGSGGDSGESKGGMHVGDLDGSSINNGPEWTAVVDVLVHDAGGAALADATVSFDYSGSRGVSGSTSCTTDGSGWCTVSVSGIPKPAGTVTFTVTDVTHATETYFAVDNHDPDGDSDGTSISVSKP